MKLECVQLDDHCDWFIEGRVYDVIDHTDDYYVIIDEESENSFINKGSMEESYTMYSNMFEVVEESAATESDEFFWKDHAESVKIAAIRSIQEQCSKANLSISIDPEGFNIFDCDTDMQTMVESVADAIEILETKIEYKDSMGKWGWL